MLCHEVFTYITEAGAEAVGINSGTKHSAGQGTISVRRGLCAVYRVPRAWHRLSSTKDKKTKNAVLRWFVSPMYSLFDPGFCSGRRDEIFYQVCFMQLYSSSGTVRNSACMISSISSFPAHNNEPASPRPCPTTPPPIPRSKSPPRDSSMGGPQGARGVPSGGAPARHDEGLRQVLRAHGRARRHLAGLLEAEGHQRDHGESIVLVKSV